MATHGISPLGQQLSLPSRQAILTLFHYDTRAIGYAPAASLRPDPTLLRASASQIAHHLYMIMFLYHM